MHPGIELGSDWPLKVQVPALRISQGISTTKGTRYALRLASSIDFLDGSDLPDPLSLSDIARKMLTISEKPVEFVRRLPFPPGSLKQLYFHSPASILNARRLTTCPVCTADDAQPVMIEEGLWDLHRNSRLHRRMTSRQKKNQTIYQTPGVYGAGT